MYTADLILKNAIVLTMDEAFNIYEPGAVAIRGDTIVAVGAENEILNQYTSLQMMDCQAKS